MNKFYALVLGLGLMLAPCISKAATVTPGPLVITYEGDGALFSQSNLKPGDKVSKTLTVTNNGSVSHNFAIATKNVSGELADKIILSPSENGNKLWSSSVSELQNLDTKSKFVTSLSRGQTKTIVLEAYLASANSENIAGKSTSFDLVYGTEESEPARGFSIFSASQTDSAVPIASPTVSPSESPTQGQVKGEETIKSGLNPWYLVIAPAAVVLSVVFLPEFAFAGSLAAVTGGAAYVLGYSSRGTLDPVWFYSILIAEIIILVILAYFLLRHDNRASRKIKGHHHRLRLR